MKISKIAIAGVLLLAISGCMKSYDTPENDTIDTSETGFLIPLEGDTGDQAKFASIDYLEQHKISTKRVQITHRWLETGRMSNDGMWIPTVRLIKVNRSPVTRLWTANGNAGAIWVESKDSIGFSMGITATAYIPEKDASTFLYWYPNGSLEKVMDEELKARCQQVCADVAAQYNLEDCRSKKEEIIAAVRTDITAFYATRGITITTIGMYGGMSYENPAIQGAIDATFINQQAKINAQSAFDAQQKLNDRVTLEADGLAEAARRKAKGEADAAIMVAQAQAQSNQLITASLEKAKENPAFLAMKALDIQEKMSERWNGQMPQWVMGGGANTQPNMLFQTNLPQK